MLLQTWTEVLQQSTQDLWLGIVAIVPSLIVASIIFVIGWIIGAVLGRVIAQIVDSLKVDNALRSAGFEETFNRAGFNLNSGIFLGGLVKWFIIIIFLVASLDVLGLNQVNIFLQEVVLFYLPQVIVAVLILLVAAVIAEVARSVVTGTAKAANMLSANLLGNVAKWAIWIFAILAALNQLGVATAFVQTLFTGVIVALSLGFGLAFGLGGQQAASSYLERLRSEVKDK